MGKSILTSDGKHLSIFENGITIDKDLLKYSSVKKELEEEKKKKATEAPQDGVTSASNVVRVTNGNPNFIPQTINLAFEKNDRVNKLQDYEFIKDGDVHQINLFLSKNLYGEVLSHFNEYNMTFDSDSIVWGNNISDSDTESDDVATSKGEKKSKSKKKSLCKKLFEVIGKTVKEAREEEKETYVLDILSFFSNVKGITKESVDKYVNRLVGYIVALKNCEVTGQTALKEKLLRDMIINKYESVLYANDLYYVITENQIVDFVKKTEKGVRLTYTKNYMRAIPSEVIDKIHQVNNLEIFDNYAVLHYDPDEKAYADTIKETKKRKDPILFGLIKGSNKLYYITDWIDEYCDLTLDKFVETLQIEKETLKMKEEL